MSYQIHTVAQLLRALERRNVGSFEHDLGRLDIDTVDGNMAFYPYDLSMTDDARIISVPCDRSYVQPARTAVSWDQEQGILRFLLSMPLTSGCLNGVRIGASEVRAKRLDANAQPFSPIVNGFEVVAQDSQSFDPVKVAFGYADNDRSLGDSLELMQRPEFNGNIAEAVFVTDYVDPTVTRLMGLGSAAAR